ncbi:MAG: type II secretion system F family protein [Candidatus Paceibacterota bacterium]|jgi:type IV pilus assembly protein PilC
MLFSYTAKVKDTGELTEGQAEALDRFALAHELRSRGFVPVSISEKGVGFLEKFGTMNSIFARVKLSEQIIFTKNLSGMLKAGLALSRGLSVLEKQTKNPELNKIIGNLLHDIDGGETFSAALAKHPKVFSKLFTSMIRAGEESGNLAGALLDIGENLEKSNSLTKKIRGALIYPGVILSAMVVIGVLMFAFVVPTLAGTFKELGVTLPLSTQLLVAVGTFFSEHLILSFVIIIGTAFAIFSIFRAKMMARPIDFLVLRLPVVGNLARELNTARTARTMSSLLSSGVSITRAVEITEDVVQNVYYKEILSQVKVEVEKGAPFSKIFVENSKLYPIMMSEMVEVGEETGKLSDMLHEVALFYEAEIENKTKNLSTIIEPVLMIFIGAAVGFFAISMISPLYSVLGQI